MTQDLIEHLLYTTKNYHHLFTVLKQCNILNDSDRFWGKLYHPELKLYNEFSNSDIFYIRSSIETIWLIQEKIGRIIPAIKIFGNNWSYKKISKTTLINEMLRDINYTNFIPSPFYKSLTIFDNKSAEDFKILYPETLNKMHIKINKNGRVVENPFELPFKQGIKISDILKQIF